MAGNFPVPLGVQLVVRWRLGTAAEAINVLHYRNTPATPIDQARADAISTLVGSAFATSALNAQLHTTVSLGSIQVRDMRNNENPYFASSIGTAPGTGTGDLLPRATSFCVSLATAKRGRSFMGRVYLWGYTEAANDATGGIATAASAASVAFVNLLKTNMLSTQNLELCVLSRYTTLPGTSVPIERNPPTLEPVVSVLAKDSRWDVQRRRAIAGV